MRLWTGVGVLAAGSMLWSLAPALARHVDRAVPGNGAVAAEAEPDLHALLTPWLSDSKISTLQKQVLAFYQARDFRPAWTDPEAAAAVVAVLGRADEQGLRTADYRSGFSEWKAKGSDAKRELALTQALFRYARDVRFGRLDPGQVYKDVRLPQDMFDIAAALNDALDNDTLDAFLANLPPPQPQYQGLVAGLARYRAIAALGGWPRIPGKGGIDLAHKDARQKLLARHLAFEDPALASVPSPTQADLHDALMRFQARNGLKPDGRAGADTLKALDIPVSARIAAIMANMERWRWMPRSFERRYVRVNVPDETADYVSGGRVLLRSRVIVGTKGDPTPILRTEIVDVEANPPWDIPDDIVAQKLLPRLRRDPHYLATRGFVLVDGPPGDPHGTGVDWRKIDPRHIPFGVQQPPGPNNVLGVVMLDMPNPFDVYLHDTPDKKIFDVDMREASHGCIRVQDILPLASLVLTGDRESGQDDLNAAIASGQTRMLKLDHPLPVYLVYWTAAAQSDGTVGFRPDRYGRDAVLLARLGKPLRPAARLLTSRNGPRGKAWRSALRSTASRTAIR